jgi:acetyl coenzyme A synthetase (ADP forming)-like protein
VTRQETPAAPSAGPVPEAGPDLSAVFMPRSVAVVGASTRRGTIGGEIFHNLIACGFRGPVYPVNPNAASVQSVAAYAGLADIPGPVDLAVIVVAKPSVQAALEGCAAKGVRAAVVISAGYKETGPEGAAAEAILKETARKHGIRLVGPNCLGILTTHPEVRLNATFAPTYPPEGSVAIASQSGALGVVIINYAREYNIGVSDFVSMGNKADLSGNDLITWWDRDARTKVMLLYLESFGNPRKFIRLARDITKRKPIVAVKSGRSLRGSRAAASHTGALAGTDAAVSAVMAQTGVIRVDTVEQLFHMAAFLAHQPVPAGNRVGILTNAGGPGILATDACETWGLEIPDLAAETAAALRAFLPPEASVKNPVDMIASASAEDYERAARLLLADPAVDSVLAIFVPPLVTEAEAVARAIVRAAQGASKPMVSCLLGRQGMPDWLESAPHGNIPSYAFPETAVRVLARAARYGSWLRRPEGTERLFPDVDKARVEAILALAGARLGREGGWLTPVEMEGIFAAYGILFTATRFAHDEEEAVVVAGELGYPVVVKLASETIAHKTDVEGVRLDLRSEDEVRRAVREIRQGMDRRGLAAAMQGVSIQRLVREGVEVFLGATQDPLFGPLVAFGLGGVQVELFHDVAFRIHPLTDQDAWDMVRGIRGYPLLAGFRGAPVADQEALVDLILRVARLVADFPGLEEMDLNPVKVFPRARGLAAVDARVRLAPFGSD